MYFPSVDWNLCQICTPCLASLQCNTRALVQIDMDDSPYLDTSRCSRCGSCVPACPYSAIKIVTPHSAIRTQAASENDSP